jgi:NADPH:quinone reductase-like Zn-dependent oxidoreductase
VKKSEQIRIVVVEEDMRAAYYEAFGGPENLQIGERPDPVPGIDQMLVRIHSAGVGVWDVFMMRGGRGPVGQASLPRIPGSEFAGTVEVAAGGFRVGDRVFGSLFASGGGGFAELAAARVDRAAALPNSIDFPVAAGLVIPAGTAHEGLIDRAKLQAGETVLVTAASGGVGTAAVQIAKNVGARVIAVASSRNHAYVRGLGADVAVDYHDSGFVEQLRRAVPNGFDVLFDGTGNEVRDQVVGLIRDGGRGIFIVGGAPPARDGVEFQYFAATVNTLRLEAIAKLASGGKLRMPVVAEFPLESARDAMEQVSGRHTVGRVVLRIGS